jgi:hypothetical protein
MVLLSGPIANDPSQSTQSIWRATKEIILREFLTNLDFKDVCGAKRAAGRRP